ncbi:MAG: hypothetical protein J5998_06940 [Clostridia bacterium]|nr:hypothetical protein [Clostridia bacterium]
MVGDKLDRSRLLIGTYCLQPYARSEAHIRALADAGVDYLCATPADGKLLDLCDKYGIGVFATGILPSWWGGDGDNAGTLASEIPVARYEEAARRFVDHPALWGVDMGDEPSALDFPHYGRLFEAARRLFPRQLPYLNLYPNYASVPENTDSQRRSQLGVPDYQTYIDEYVRCVKSDYICYDYYMYATSIAGAYENLRVVADKCRGTGRDLWIVLQVNSNRPSEWMSLSQLRHQAYTALAFGARSINWACWTAGWWHNQVLDDAGRPTRQYARICAVNRELHAMGARYMRYRNRATHFIGSIPADRLAGVGQAAEPGFSAGSFRDVRVEEGFGAVIGHMTDADGARDALMAADVSGREEAAYLRFRKAGLKPAALLNGLPVPVLRVGPDEYRVRLEPCSGLLIEQADSEI